MTCSSQKKKKKAIIAFALDFETTVADFLFHPEVSDHGKIRVWFHGVGLGVGRRGDQTRGKGVGRRALHKKSLPLCIRDPGDPRLAVLQGVQKFLGKGKSLH
jgi:hypothetical protein